MEAMRILIAFASYIDFKLFQMDAKSAFMNEYLKEEIYEKKPLRFEDIAIPIMYLCWIKLCLGWSKHPWPGMNNCQNFFWIMGSKRGKFDNTLFLKAKGSTRSEQEHGQAQVIVFPFPIPSRTAQGHIEAGPGCGSSQRKKQLAQH